jgi:hypothetical protein
MRYAVEMGSVAMIYIPGFIKTWFRLSKVNKGGFTDTQTAWRSHKTTLRK